MSEENITADAVDEVIESTDELIEESGDESEAIAEESGEVSVEAESVEELQDEIEQAIDEGASEEEVKDMVREFQLKVNGKTVSKKIDLSDEAALTRELQMAEAGRGAMQRSRELEKAYESALSELQADPLKVLEEMGIDVDALSESRITSRIEHMKKTPEQIEREEIQAELKAAREEARALKEEKQARDQAKQMEEHQQLLDVEIKTALDGHATLPSSQKTYAKIVDTLLSAMDAGMHDVRVEDVLPIVEQELEAEMQEFFNDQPEEFYAKFLGKKNMNSLREKRVAKVKKANNVSNIAAVTKPKTDDGKPKKKVRAKDWFETLV